MSRSSPQVSRPPADPFGAFCVDNHVAQAHAGSGPLDGLTFAIKDVFDVEGTRTGFGHPQWLATHEEANVTAEAVSWLLAAGADLTGRTQSDELCYSLSGENQHYGMPINPRAPERLPGGSSSGSAVAVAGELVDFAIGTDCGGSVRVPASYCGLFGIRPTHGHIPLTGVSRFAPRFDTVGWFARDAATLRRVGEVLIGPLRTGRFSRVIVAQDAFLRVDPRTRAVLDPAVAHIIDLVGARADDQLSREGLAGWFDTFRLVQGGEIWESLGPWIEEVHPAFGTAVGARLVDASRLDPGAVREARARADAIALDLAARIGDGDLVVLPTTPGIAPLRSTDATEVEVEFRRRSMELLCVAGLGGLPQVSLPVGDVDGAPVGLSILARRGKDMDLLDFAVTAFGAPDSRVAPVTR